MKSPAACSSSSSNPSQLVFEVQERKQPVLNTADIEVCVNKLGRRSAAFLLIMKELFSYAGCNRVHGCCVPLALSEMCFLFPPLCFSGQYILQPTPSQKTPSMASLCPTVEQCTCLQPGLQVRHSELVHLRGTKL